MNRSLARDMAEVVRVTETEMEPKRVVRRALIFVIGNHMVTY
jgi:hypothetical protein